MIQLRNIHKSFGENHVLQGVDLEVQDGEVVSIIGASGSGKSTFLRTINFLEPADEGEIILDDIRVDAARASKADILNLRRCTAMVFQSYNLLKHRTALENVMKAAGGRPEERQERSRRNRSRGTEPRRSGRPYGVLSPPAVRRTAAEGRYRPALAISPKVAFQDEPTSALDPEMVGGVLDVIRSIAKDGMTMIIVTHEMNFAREVSNQVAFFDEGKILEQGTPQELFLNTKEERTRQFLQRIQR